MSHSRGAIKRTEADKWFSKAVRLSHDDLCERCRRPATELAHIKGRRDTSTRYLVCNGLSFCHSCHKWSEENPLDFVDWLEVAYPGRKLKIQIAAQGTLKNTAFNRKLISKHYRDEYRRMQETGDRDLKSW